MPPYERYVGPPEPKRTPAPHACAPTGPAASQAAAGSIWRCDTCQALWMTIQTGSGVVWTEAEVTWEGAVNINDYPDEY